MKTSSSKWTRIVIAALAALAAPAFLDSSAALAQSVYEAKQGEPGKKGPWPMKVQWDTTVDGGLPVQHTRICGMTQIDTDSTNVNADGGTLEQTRPTSATTEDWLRCSDNVRALFQSTAIYTQPVATGLVLNEGGSNGFWVPAGPAMWPLVYPGATPNDAGFNDAGFASYALRSVSGTPLCTIWRITYCP